MHILYLDEAGTHSEARYFVVAGLSLFERQTYHLAREVDHLVGRFFPDQEEPVELHASALRAPDEHVKPPYSGIARGDRLELLDSIYDVVVRAECRLFAIAMEKSFVGDNLYERGFEEAVNRFDIMLDRVNRERDERNRGLVVLAESSYRENLEALARQVWKHGTRWRPLGNIADIPYFAPARNTRLLQLADFVVNAVFARYESSQTRQFDRLAPCFDQENGRLHGLLHLTGNRQCYCPACMARRA